MNKKQFAAGAVLGFVGTFLGCILYLSLFTTYEIKTGFAILESQGALGKLITLGSVINLLLFGVLLKLNQEMMARGVILSVIVMAILTIFI
ncbi:hypothetical protein [Flavobacterium sp.]|uniref:hypothetical protein n=1 Tax=Flavobacterium sp. TaxID=239 RepID=UPI0026370C0D|nr:hypothetical protein [Flavobacterium sp.]MDG2431487.1 hypothetical protein [Flavobacterium sp.]